MEEKDLLINTVKFIQKILLVSEEEFMEKDIVRIRRVRSARNSKSPHEVMVTFDEKYSRDRVAAHARNLADHWDENDNPTAGMRLDYPSFLSGTFRDLEWYGAHLRRTHGQGTRRNIKFDEEKMSLYMDVKLPGEKTNWLRVSPEMAKEEKMESQEQRDNQTRMQLRTTRNSGQDITSTRLPAGQPLINGANGKTPNFQDDLERLRRKNKQANTDEEMMDFDPNFNGFPNESYRSPKKK